MHKPALGNALGNKTPPRPSQTESPKPVGPQAHAPGPPALPSAKLVSPSSSLSTMPSVSPSWEKGGYIPREELGRTRGCGGRAPGGRLEKSASHRSVWALQTPEVPGGSDRYSQPVSVPRADKCFSVRIRLNRGSELSIPCKLKSSGGHQSFLQIGVCSFLAASKAVGDQGLRCHARAPQPQLGSLPPPHTL